MTSRASRPDNLIEASICEEVFLESGKKTVLVLQELLKNVAKLLVYGRRYSDMTRKQAVNFEKNFWPVRSDRCETFFDSDDFPGAAAFFSRAYCQADANSEDNMAIPEHYCQTTIEAIEAMFEHFHIVREPPWIKSNREDWVDDLREDAMALKTVNEWRRFETKWATITSYACGLNLHEGPWAGEDWRSYVYTPPWD
jgi:hypothetical protein